MGTKKQSLVDSFVFLKAKESTDQVTKSTPLPSPNPAAQPPSRQPDPLPNRQPDPLPNRQPDPLSFQPPLHTSIQLPSQPAYDIFKDCVWSITEKQAKVLFCLIQNKSGVTQREKICKVTDIAEGTVKDSLRILYKHKFISKPRQYRQGRFQGFSYTINEELCRRFIEERWNHHPFQPPVQPTTCPTSLATDTISSSLYNKQTTTTDVFGNHPELGYWRQKGLTVKQVEQWIKAAGCNLDCIIQSLCHCRFEMVDMGLEESKPVENVFNWFYRIIERTGYYPAPKGYKSFEQKQLQRERQLIEEREKRIQELKEIHCKKWEQERDLEFWEMMNNPKGELYKECYARLNSFQRDFKNGKMFEMAMVKAFDEIMLERDKDKVVGDKES